MEEQLEAGDGPWHRCDSCDAPLCPNCILSCDGASSRCDKLFICGNCVTECKSCMDAFCADCQRHRRLEKCKGCGDTFCGGRIYCRVLEEGPSCSACKSKFCESCTSGFSLGMCSDCAMERAREGGGAKRARTE